MGSILTTIKKMLGIVDEYEQFDIDIIMHINSTFMILNQLGVGPSECFAIQDKTAVWSDFIQDKTNIEAVKTYMYLQVKLLFDPPSGSSMDSFNRSIEELTWRLNVISDKS